MIQADHELKTLINNNLEMFLEVARNLSLVKGCRWDDIVMKFEYLAIELPALSKHLESVSISQEHKTYVQSHLKDHHDLDIKGLQEVIAELELSEKSPKYSDIISRATSESHQRIKHA